MAEKERREEGVESVESSRESSQSSRVSRRIPPKKSQVASHLSVQRVLHSLVQGINMSFSYNALFYELFLHVLEYSTSGRHSTLALRDAMGRPQSSRIPSSLQSSLIASWHWTRFFLCACCLCVAVPVQTDCST